MGMLKRTLLLLCLALIYHPAANAGWLDDMFNNSKKAVRKFMDLGEENLPRITDKDLGDYPKHYQFYRVIEPIHNSPLFFVESGADSNNNKPIVILIHGLGEAASKDWLSVIPALENDYHVFALDLPGFGLSQGQYFKYSPKQYSRVINWFIDNYAQNKPTIVGHSMGGAVSLFFAATYPQQLKKLVLVDAAGVIRRTTFVKHLADLDIESHTQSSTLRRFTARVENFSDQMVELTGSMYDPTTLVNKEGTLRKLTLSGSTNANAALALMETDFSTLDYSKVVPTQLIWGADDPVAPARTGVAIADVLAHAQLHLIVDAGHVPMKSKTEQFNQTLLNALANEPVADEKERPEPSKRIGQCVRDDHTQFSGYYQSLSLNNCKLVKLNNVVAKNFSSNESYVEIQHSVLGSRGGVTNIKDSAIEATASTFNGKFVSENSRFDLAGVEFQAGEVTFESVDNTQVIISLSNINSTTYQGTAHGFFELGNGSLDQLLFQEKFQESSRKDH